MNSLLCLSVSLVFFFFSFFNEFCSEMRINVCCLDCCWRLILSWEVKSQTSSADLRSVQVNQQWNMKESPVVVKTIDRWVWTKHTCTVTTCLSSVVQHEMCHIHWAFSAVICHWCLSCSEEDRKSTHVGLRWSQWDSVKSWKSCGQSVLYTRLWENKQVTRSKIRPYVIKYSHQGWGLMFRAACKRLDEDGRRWSVSPGDTRVVTQQNPPIKNRTCL